MPQSIVGLDTLLFAVIIIHLSKAEDIQCELQAIIVVEKLNATSNGKHNVGVVLPAIRRTTIAEVVCPQPAGAQGCTQKITLPAIRRTTIAEVVYPQPAGA
jgi:hypothetical protein